MLQLVVAGLTWARESGTRGIQIQVHVERHVTGGSGAGAVV